MLHISRGQTSRRRACPPERRQLSRSRMNGSSLTQSEYSSAFEYAFALTRDFCCCCCCCPRSLACSPSLRRRFKNSAARSRTSALTDFFFASRSSSVRSQPSGVGTNRAKVKYDVCDWRRWRGCVMMVSIPPVCSAASVSLLPSRGRLCSLRHPTLAVAKSPSATVLPARRTLARAIRRF